MVWRDKDKWRPSTSKDNDGMLESVRQSLKCGTCAGPLDMVIYNLGMPRYGCGPCMMKAREAKTEAEALAQREEEARAALANHPKMCWSCYERFTGDTLYCPPCIEKRTALSKPLVPKPEITTRPRTPPKVTVTPTKVRSDPERFDETYRTDPQSEWPRRDDRFFEREYPNVLSAGWGGGKSSVVATALVGSVQKLLTGRGREAREGHCNGTIRCTERDGCTCPCEKCGRGVVT